MLLGVASIILRRALEITWSPHHHHTMNTLQAHALQRRLDRDAYHTCTVTKIYNARQADVITVAAEIGFPCLHLFYSQRTAHVDYACPVRVSAFQTVI